MKTDIKLQFFSGFYESIWLNGNSLVDYEYEEGLDYEDYDFDSGQYKHDVAERIVECYQSWLNELFGENVATVTFQGVRSPQYYNYSTDSINVQVEFDDSVIAVMKEKFEKWKDLLYPIIRENHRSYSGFWSYLSDDPEEWMDKCFNEDERYQPAYLSCLLDYLIFAHKKWAGETNIDLNYEAYYCVEIYPESYCSPKVFKVRVDWDLDDPDDGEGLPEIVSVPNEVKEEEVSDWLSDEYGFCVKSWTLHKKW